MNRLIFPTLAFGVFTACDVIDRNPCDRYADFLCDCYGPDSSECQEVSRLAQNPTAEVQESCEIDLSQAQRDTSDCLDFAGDTGVAAWWDTAGW